MKTVIILCVLAVSVSALPQARYSDKYDTVDLDQILVNDRLLAGYINCLLEKGKCSVEGKELKSHIREALENNCAKCTATQQTGTRRVIGHLINHKPDYWNELSTKYDATGKYAKKYEADLKTISK